MHFAHAIPLQQLINSGALDTMFLNKKIGIYLGSFDPVTEGHKHFVKQSIDLRHCDYVFVLADATRIDNPDNMSQGYDPKIKSDFQTCNKMLELAFSGDENIITTTMNPKELQDLLTEVDGESPPLFTSSDNLLNDSPFVKFKWNAVGVGLVGSDTAGWVNLYDSKKQQPPANLKLAGFLRGVQIPNEFADTSEGTTIALPVQSFVVGIRKGSNSPKEITDIMAKTQNLWCLGDRNAQFIKDLGDFAEVSSTEIRKALTLINGQGEEQRKLAEDYLGKNLDPKVLEYILINGLYKPDYFKQRELEALKLYKKYLTYLKYQHCWNYKELSHYASYPGELIEPFEQELVKVKGYLNSLNLKLKDLLQKNENIQDVEKKIADADNRKKYIQRMLNAWYTLAPAKKIKA
jgi:nicotinic acid mononucleotide adenylyltransferase